jgi:o-succinylbenzoate---CoA ligase
VSRSDAPAVLVGDDAVSWGELERSARELDRDLTHPVISADLAPGAEAAALLMATDRANIALEPLAPGQAPSRADLPEGTRTLMRTSGSTGEPRPVALTRSNHEASVRAAESHLGLTPDDRWLACLPLHHVGGLSIFVRSAHTGFAVVPVWPFEPEAVIAAIQRHAVTAVSLVPTMLARLLEHRWEAPASVRFVLLGGAPCPPLLLQAALEAGIPVAPTYGMTETCSQVATLLPDEVSEHFGSSGRALPGADLRADADGRIAIRGSMVSPDAVTEDGWLVTNDLGVIDGEGYLTVLGRSDDAILSGGEKVIPRTVEEILLEDPGVAEAVVVGVPDPEWGQRVVAAVTPRSGAVLDPLELRAAVRERLAPHMTPRTVVVLDELPRTGPDKVDRPKLRVLLAEEGT